jgi:hypothetical protein
MCQSRWAGKRWTVGSPQSYETAISRVPTITIAQLAAAAPPPPMAPTSQ